MIFDPTEKPFSEIHKLMIGSIVPRPIALVSTTSKDGNNNHPNQPGQTDDIDNYRSEFQ